MKSYGVLLGALIGCAGAVSAHAQTPEAEGTASAPMAGLRIFLDPVTGEIRQPASEDLDSTKVPLRPEAAVKSTLQNSFVRLPDGTLMLPARAHMHRVLAAVATDGRIETRCLTQPQQGK